MTLALIALPFLALMVWVFVVGLKAARTRKLSMFGLVPAGCAVGAFAWSVFVPGFDYVPRVAAGMAAIAAGIAHGVWFSLVALPARTVWLRLLIVPVDVDRVDHVAVLVARKRLRRERLTQSPERALSMSAMRHARRLGTRDRSVHGLRVVPAHLLARG
jgi:hypothetical protein